MKDDKQLNEVLNTIGLLDIICFIPMLFLFSYLPSAHWWQILINFLIISLCAIGTTRMLYFFKDKLSSSINKH
ncbi:DUF6007 family protein [Staphylococcus simulans]|uniref:DUF6007 family protein n=1 Tax=Staphylococcus simulans TaxID=1286 RepID=UPI003999E91E